MVRVSPVFLGLFQVIMANPGVGSTNHQLQEISNGPTPSEQDPNKNPKYFIALWINFLNGVQLGFGPI